MSNFDVSKEDLALTNLVVSNVNTFNSKSGNQLVTVQLVGLKKYTTLPNLFYFGDLEYDKLKALEGQKVSVLLGTSQQGFNIKALQTA